MKEEGRIKKKEGRIKKKKSLAFRARAAWKIGADPT
jgi:hypothetical protein